jgi:predicted O-methyltransferase YrrM
MNTSQFNDLEAKFIAKEIILKRLGIIPDNDSVISYSESFKDTIKNIESIETTWECALADKSHTYGRKESNETIKLWSVPPMTAKVLENLVAYTNAKNILEIGTSAGYSTLHLANALVDGRVYTIEILDEKVKLATKHFKEAKLEDKISLLHSDADTVLKNWNYGMIDLVFLDADKENYGKYFEQIVPLMSKNGLIIADNINDYGHMMQDYLQKVTGTHLPHSRCDRRVISTYVAQLDNGVMITKKI